MNILHTPLFHDRYYQSLSMHPYKHVKDPRFIINFVQVIKFIMVRGKCLRFVTRE